MSEVHKKEVGKIGLIGFSVLVVILAVSNLLTYTNLQNQITTLNNEKNALQSQVNTLQTNYSELNVSFHVLNTSYFELQNRYSGLQSQYEELNGRYVTLQTNYQKLVREQTSLQSSFNSLTQSYSSLQRDFEVEKTLRIGNSLESYYDYLRQELGPTGAKYWWLTYTESYWQTQADFSANLALHDLRRIYWPSIEEDYYKDVGEYSYDTARKKIDETIALIEIKVYDTSTERIRKTLNFVHQYIHYETEVNDIFLAPVETLGFRSGDCDDFAILTASLFETMGIDSAIGFFRNENNEYHAMVLIHLEDLSGYHYWYFSDLTDKGLEKGRWIIIEPQTTIDNQGTDWIEQWKLLVAAPLDTQ